MEIIYTMYYSDTGLQSLWSVSQAERLLIVVSHPWNRGLIKGNLKKIRLNQASIP